MGQSVGSARKLSPSAQNAGQIPDCCEVGAHPVRRRDSMYSFPERRAAKEVRCVSIRDEVQWLFVSRSGVIRRVPWGVRWVFEGEVV
jgi:hypothetical protein